MPGKPPFDGVKWSFYLVASVIWFHCVVVLIAVVFCAFHTGPEHIERCTNVRGQLVELLAGALAAALAFAGGFKRGDK